MKPVSFKIPKSGQSSFRVQVDDVPYFYDRLHYHPEVQITYIQRSAGTLFVGDSIKRFNAGDLLIIGSNVPHLLKNDESYYRENGPGALGISFFFDEQSFGKGFFSLPEMVNIAQLIKASGRGIRILKPEEKQFSADILAIVEAQKFARFHLLLGLLNQLSEWPAIEFLSAHSFSESPTELDGQRLNAVYHYLLNNFHRPISLEEAATTANLSVSAFCRYFKLRTRKTFVQYLNELRISKACKLLSEQQYSIAQISYQVGFNNLSNFNRKFKQITGFTPSAYQRQF